jgi:hypothetical protein
LSITDYLKSRAVCGPWQIQGCVQDGFAGAVVIPALAESATLLATLCSLSRNPPEMLSQFFVLVVVNHREDARAADKADNLLTLKLLSTGNPQLSQLNLAWIDAASPGFELPAKGGGVGLARKIGLDRSLLRLDSRKNDPLLVCLDADTLVRPDYLPALMRHFDQSTRGAAVIPFQHQQGLSPQADAAVIRYELFLRSYIFGLNQAGSPYAFHSVGSAMACRISAYVKIGGMNNRSAGEDFYFLQQLARTVGVDQVSGTVVYPSQRASHRVPFGTGRSISRLLDGGDAELLFYQSPCFRILGEWLTLVSDSLDSDSADVMKRAGEISKELTEYLYLNSFSDIWPKLRKNNPGSRALQSAFDGWFDGLKTLKLIHHLSAVSYPRCSPDEALPDMLRWGGLDVVSGLEAQLELLRCLQSGDDYAESGELLS